MVELDIAPEGLRSGVLGELLETRLGVTTTPAPGPASRTAPLEVRERPPPAVVIATRDRVDMLEHCLDSLRRLDEAPARVVVVDNHSTGPDTMALVERLGHPVRVVKGLAENVKITTPDDLRRARRAWGR